MLMPKCPCCPECRWCENSCDLIVENTIPGIGALVTREENPYVNEGRFPYPHVASAGPSACNIIDEFFDEASRHDTNFPVESPPHVPFPYQGYDWDSMPEFLSLVNGRLYVPFNHHNLAPGHKPPSRVYQHVSGQSPFRILVGQFYYEVADRTPFISGGFDIPDTYIKAYPITFNLGPDEYLSTAVKVMAIRSSWSIRCAKADDTLNASCYGDQKTGVSPPAGYVFNARLEVSGGIVGGVDGGCYDGWAFDGIPKLSPFYRVYYVLNVDFPLLERTCGYPSSFPCAFEQTQYVLHELEGVRVRINGYGVTVGRPGQEVFEPWDCVSWNQTIPPRRAYEVTFNGGGDCDYEVKEEYDISLETLEIDNDYLSCHPSELLSNDVEWEIRRSDNSPIPQNPDFLVSWGGMTVSLYEHVPPLVDNQIAGVGLQEDLADLGFFGLVHGYEISEFPEFEACGVLWRRKALVLATNLDMSPTGYTETCNGDRRYSFLAWTIYRGELLPEGSGRVVNLRVWRIDKLRHDEPASVTEVYEDNFIDVCTDDPPNSHPADNTPPTTVPQ